MNYTYPALFERNPDSSYTITFPDLKGCISEGKSLENALFMAKDELQEWCAAHIENSGQLPAASEINSIPLLENSFTSYITASVKDSRSVRRTVSLPEWLDKAAADRGLSLSRVLQDSLKNILEL